MQGINNSKHRHLVDALLQFQNMLDRDFERDTDRQQAEELRLELEALHCSYSKQVNVLAELIGDYHELFSKVKLQFLSPKLKELKKQAEHDTRIWPMLAKSIQLVYGT